MPEGREVVTYNTGNGRTSPASDARVKADILRLLDLDPDAVLLQEVGNRRGVLAEVADATGWTLVQGTGLSGHVAVLVSPLVKVTGWRTIKLNDSTRVGRNVAGSRVSGRAPARWMLVVRCKDAAGRFKVASTHFVPSATRRGNRAAKALHGRQVRRVARWMRRSRVPVYVGVDANAALNRAREAVLLAPLNRRGLRARSKPSHGHRAIDLIVTNRPRRRASVRALENYTSDHRPIIYKEAP